MSRLTVDYSLILREIYTEQRKKFRNILVACGGLGLSDT